MGSGMLMLAEVSGGWGFGLGLAAAVFIVLLLYIAMKKPSIGAIMPYVATAVKIAEGAIDDDTPNKSLAKADRFLKEFSRLWKDDYGKNPPKNVVELAQTSASVLASQAKLTEATQKGIANGIAAAIKAVEEMKANVDSSDTDDPGGSS